MPFKNFLSGFSLLLLITQLLVSSVLAGSSGQKFSNNTFATDLNGWNSGSAALTASAVSFWNLEETSGTRSDSFSSNNLNSSNGVTQSVGKVLNAAHFTSSSSQSLTIADNDSLGTGDIDFSISAWVYLDSIGGAGVFNTVAAKDDMSVTREWVLFTGNGNPRLRFATSSTGSSSTGNTQVSATTTVTTGTWYFVVAWQDSINKTLNIQVDNNPVVSNSYTTGPSHRSSPFVIGADNVFNFWDGRIDAVGFWKKALTASDRASLYNSGNGLQHPFLTATRDTSTVFPGTSASAKLIAPSSSAGEFTQTFSLGDDNTHGLSAYAYTDGSAVTSADISLYANNIPIATSYTSVGGGWYQLSGVVRGLGFTNYGVQIQAGKTVYISSPSLIGTNPDSTGSSPANQCFDPTSPTGIPDLFQIDASKTSVDLFFTSTVTNANKYEIFYGLTPLANQYSYSFTPNNILWISKATINALNPNTSYYFKIRAVNGCNVSPFGKAIKVITTNGVNKVKYYK